MSELSLIKKSDSLKELMLKYQVPALKLASVVGIKSKKTIYLKIADVSMFSIPELIVMSEFFEVDFLDLCDLIKRELDLKKAQKIS